MLSNIATVNSRINEIIQNDKIKINDDMISDQCKNIKDQAAKFEVQKEKM